jgi:2',3'-cyclic-nucleotide 2'-phosphodiesterase
MIRLLFFGDVYGKPGRRVLFDHLQSLINEFQTDFAIINGENIADGRGLTEKTSKPLFHCGVDAITGGNHLWDRADSWEYIRNTATIIKPLNFPSVTPGNPCLTLEKDGKQLSIITLCGQMFMSPSDSPFVSLEKWLQNNPNRPKSLLIDFHAESTAEKRALGWFADGYASAIIGTHTHIQTADEEILPQGTAYITDVGMTGSHDGVIGVRKNIILEKFWHSLPSRYESSDGGLQINAVYIEIDAETGKALKIERIRRKVELSANSLEME